MNNVRHGEVVLKVVSGLPVGAVLESENKEIIVAHSETGHHHVLSTLDMSKIKVYSHNGEKYLEVPQIAELWHQKSGSDVHKTHKIMPNIYKIQIKKAYDYFAKMMANVRD